MTGNGHLAVFDLDGNRVIFFIRIINIGINLVIRQQEHLVHDVDVEGIDTHPDPLPYLLGNGGVDQPLAVLAAHLYLKVDALEHDVLDHADQLSLIGGDDLDILGPDHNVDRGVHLETLVDTVQLDAEQANLFILQHDAVDDIGLADKIGDKRVGGLVINILGGTDLSDDAVVHDDNAVAHGQRLLLIVGHINKCLLGLELELLELNLHILAQFQIQRAQRLVQQDDLGIADKGAGDGDALLLTA